MIDAILWTAIKFESGTVRNLMLRTKLCQRPEKNTSIMTENGYDLTVLEVHECIPGPALMVICEQPLFEPDLTRIPMTDQNAQRMLGILKNAGFIEGLNGGRRLGNPEDAFLFEALKTKPELFEPCSYLVGGLLTDGAHHKQHFILNALNLLLGNENLNLLRVELSKAGYEFEGGIAP